MYIDTKRDFVETGKSTDDFVQQMRNLLDASSSNHTYVMSPTSGRLKVFIIIFLTPGRCLYEARSLKTKNYSYY